MCRRRQQGEKRGQWVCGLDFIECYDHAFTEREEEDLFAAFQQAVETKAVALSGAMKAPIPPLPAERNQERSLPTITQQIQEDLAFWEDKV